MGFSLGIRKQPIKALPLFAAPDMANDNSEELSAEEAEEHLYDTVGGLDKTEQSQRLAVEELINTEISYVHNLQLCISDIRSHLQKKQVRLGRGGPLPRSSG